MTCSAVPIAIDVEETSITYKHGDGIQGRYGHLWENEGLGEDLRSLPLLEACR